MSETATNNLKLYEALAHAFAAEGVDHQFGLMGDGNMHSAEQDHGRVR
jgi:hypothetical protein